MPNGDGRPRAAKISCMSIRFMWSCTIIGRSLPRVCTGRGVCIRAIGTSADPKMSLVSPENRTSFGMTRSVSVIVSAASARSFPALAISFVMAARRPVWLPWPFLAAL
jgi:hypothetical protein